ncbi:YebC/PmpR family DNA-binding transcriptional regulator [Candidatus Dependentiae bacterium]|nr:YebC/PmpR family DNA-binding transcriptional regulator [Candidatus Dependentiae bacterium]
MSGHSKWATIKRKKAALDSKRGRIFTRLGKEISVVARDGGGDPSFNPRLRLLIDKAKAANMPADNIDRAIKRGTGAVDGAHYEFHRYEGYATNGVALIVETLSDNKNRTVADVRHYFNKHGGRLAADGSVSWMFAHKGQVTVAKDGATEDALLEKLMEYDIDEVFEDEDGFKVLGPVSSLDSVRHAAENAGFKVLSAEMIWKAKDVASSLTDEQAEGVATFIDGLEDIDDVQAVFDNLG